MSTEHDFSKPLTYDPSMDNIPPEVLAAAALVTQFAERHGGGYWELGGVCSRNHADHCRAVSKKPKIKLFVYVKYAQDSSLDFAAVVGAEDQQAAAIEIEYILQRRHNRQEDIFPGDVKEFDHLGVGLGSVILFHAIH